MVTCKSVLGYIRKYAVFTNPMLIYWHLNKKRKGRAAQ